MVCLWNLNPTTRYTVIRNRYLVLDSVFLNNNVAESLPERMIALKRVVRVQH